MTGTAFTQYAANMDEAQREQAILTEVGAGNLPDFLRNLKPIRLQHTFKDGARVTAIICVTPDYLAIGSNTDFLRIPMNFYTAVAVARRLGFVLPTRKMVDAVAEQAAYRLRPQPMPPGPHMRSMYYYRRHNSQVAAQQFALKCPLGALVAGHKKDVVLTNRLLSKPGRIAIYGWHQPTGEPIQPLSTVHGARYADYSHGIRLVSNVVFIDGMPWSMYEVLQHPRLGKILSQEGGLHDLKRLMGAAS
jgi:hypothetical protein